MNSSLSAVSRNYQNFQSLRYTNSTPSEAYNTMSAQQESVRKIDEKYLIQNILENETTFRNISINSKKRRPHFFISFDSLRDKAYNEDKDTSFQNRSFVV